MIPVIDDDDETKRITIEPTNLNVLVDVYKHHWDLFIKGVAFYLAGCSILAGFATSEKATIFAKLFVGGAVAVGSIVAFLAIRAALAFLTVIAENIDTISDGLGYRRIPFKPAKQIVAIFLFTTVILCLTGILFLVHIYVYEWPSDWPKFKL